jgi:hypothetical protein
MTRILQIGICFDHCVAQAMAGAIMCPEMSMSAATPLYPRYSL